MKNAVRIASHRALFSAKPSICSAAFFWAFMYAVLSLRATWGIDHGFDAWSHKRALATGIGAFIYLVILVHVVDAPNLSSSRQLKTALTLILPSAAIVLTARILFDNIMGVGEVAVTSDLRWTLVWTGYFAASIAAYITYRYHRQSQLLEHQSVIVGDVGNENPSSNLTFWAQNRGVSVRLTPDTIERFEAEGNYIRIHGLDGSTGLVRLAMRQLIEDLDPDEFIRIHRSTICSTNEIQAVRRHSGGGASLVLRSGVELAVGRSFYKAVLNGRLKV